MKTPKTGADQRKVPKAELNDQSLDRLGRAFWSLVGHYDLSREEQALVLGVKNNRQRLGDLETKKLIPDDPDKALRVGLLLGIHKSLRIMYPHNREVVYAWMKTRRDLFNGRSAIEFIGAGADTLPRLFTVRRLLDQIRVGQ